MEGGTGTVTIETLQRLVDAFNAHDVDAVMGYFTDNPVLELPRGPDPWGRRFQGREAVRAGLASRFAGIPDVHYGDDRHWVRGDRGCSEWLLTGTTPAPLRELPVGQVEVVLPGRPVAGCLPNSFQTPSPRVMRTRGRRLASRNSAG